MSVWKKLRHVGVKVLPTIYNDANGYGYALLPRFMAMAANPDSFIEQAVSLAVAGDLEGWNLDLQVRKETLNSTRTARCCHSTLRLLALARGGLRRHSTHLLWIPCAT